MSSFFEQVKWNFPENNDGAEEGLNDAGVETFRGAPLESLAREIIQNSSDARYDKTKPVRVVFDLINIDTQDFPNQKDYIQILDNCENYWNDNIKTKAFFQKAKAQLSKKTIPVLKVSDYNTTGLTGSKDAHNSNWFGLIKSTGVSNKSGGSGGSFGIGKNAPFACSDLRTVFYNTYDIENIRAFQGVGKLATHEKLNGEKTRATGYFGAPEKNTPIYGEDIEDAPIYKLLLERENYGTDIIIFGFSGKKNWQHRMIVSILENFFFAIHSNLLEVIVDGIELNKNTLEERIKEFVVSEKKALSPLYYNAIKSGIIFEKNDEEFDGLRLFLLEGKDLPKRIAMIRGMGMKIFDKGNFRGTTRFIGVLVVEGPKANARLRELEPPSHDKWEPERGLKGVSKEERYLKKMNEWIKDCIEDLISEEDGEELDFLGAGKFLPTNIEEPINNIKKLKRETLDREDVKQKINIRIKKIPKTASQSVKVVKSNGEIGEGDKISFNGNSKNKKGGSSINRRTSINGNSDVTVGKVTDRELNVNIRRLFMVKEMMGEYRVSFTPNETKVGYFSVDVMGETSKETFTIAEAKTTKGKPIEIKDGKFIGPFEFQKGKEEAILFRFEKPVRYALNIQVLEGK
ncbi:hypothetical protein P9D28_14815 [Bacillus haynesii]|uniref:hypothetical protein n=1 Tax=Bacillus haynesii TaxID=1925021 RepID=UPI002DBD7F81|nr:hypothetical protein [Bacillus haynesii]MEC1553708.1 hypothetical protein [Bacillus haynesii]